MSGADAHPGARRPGSTPARGYRRDPAWSNHVEPVTPVTDRRLTGAHWWDPDRIAHASDAPRFCPACAAALDGVGSMAVEYWEGDRRVFHTRCGGCGWSGDIIRVERMVGHEAPHD